MKDKVSNCTGAAERTQVQLTISPRDPIIIRDGRPFGAGSEGANRARSLDWLYPSTAAGAIRTLVGKIWAEHKAEGAASNPFHNVAFLLRLKLIKIRGPLPLADGTLYVPRPLDFWEYESGYRATLRPKPLQEGEGCDLPNKKLWPLSVPLSEKPARMSPFWSMETVASWLAQDIRDNFSPGQVLDEFKKEVRVHVKIDSATGTADDSQLFFTQGLAIPDVDFRPRNVTTEQVDKNGANKSTKIVLLVETEDGELGDLLPKIDTIHTLGGERRLVRFLARDPINSWWCCPPAVKEALGEARGVRMLLATPAVFQSGWLPGWINPETLEGSPPGVDGLVLRLRGASIGRWQAISGWSKEKGKRGPKPVKRVVPAGSVYFFEVVKGSAQELADLWLRSVSDKNPNQKDDSDREQDRNDGFGLALWGVWQIDTDKGGSVL